MAHRSGTRSCRRRRTPRSWPLSHACPEPVPGARPPTAAAPEPQEPAGRVRGPGQSRAFHRRPKPAGLPPAWGLREGLPPVAAAPASRALPPRPGLGSSLRKSCLRRRVLIVPAASAAGPGRAVRTRAGGRRTQDGGPRVPCPHTGPRPGGQPGPARISAAPPPRLTGRPWYLGAPRDCVPGAPCWAPCSPHRGPRPECGWAPRAQAAFPAPRARTWQSRGFYGLGSTFYCILWV